MADDAKTEQPTPRHREKAREQGQVARSRDLTGALALAACVAVLFGRAESSMLDWRNYTRFVIEYGATHDLQSAWPMARWTAIEALSWCALPMLAAWGASVLVSVGQGGVLFAPAAIAPKLERLSPIGKLKQMVSLAHLSQILKAMIPAAAMLWIVVAIYEREWATMTQSSMIGLRPFLGWFAATTSEIVWKSTLVMALWSAADYLMVWQKHESDLKMSRQELREEFKQNEGNPQVKSQLRRMQRQMRRKQMLDNVKKASVVVVNPTHFAVAIEYGPTLPAPVVVAKGRNLLAQQIKQAARWHNIPIMENPPLAQALYRMTEVGQMIPSKLYTAVAEILAFVFRMQAQASARARRPRG